VRGLERCNQCEVRSGPNLHARRLCCHGLPLTRVLTVVPGACARCHLRILLLGQSGAHGRARHLGYTRRARLPARTAQVQPCLPRRRRLDALQCLALQHLAQRRPALGLWRMVLLLQLLVPKRVFRFRLHSCGIEKCKCGGGDFLSPSLWLPKVFIRTKP
jgi:hypothetical protein